jgi:hypothetical protein
MQVSILEGAFADGAGNIRPSLPINMQPVITDSGFSKGYLRTAPGLTLTATGPGQDRGSFISEGVHYRVMGSKLVGYNTGIISVLGDVGNDGLPVKFDVGFDGLAVYSAGNVYFWNGAEITQIANPSIGYGPPIDMCWIDGYFMLTDGQSLYVTELNNQTQLLNNAYEQPPADPNPVLAVMRVRDEVYACTRNSIQNFQNVGGVNFPFQYNPSGLIPRGPIGTHAVCYFLNTLAFVGNGIKETPSVYIAGFGTTTSISTPEVDRQLAQLTYLEYPTVEVESVTEKGEQRLYIHLPNGSLIYHNQASQAAGKPIWTWVASGPQMNQPYPVRHFATQGDVYYGGSTTGQIGMLDETVNTQFGVTVPAQFDTLFLYNESNGAILKSAELVGTVSTPSTAYLSWTRHGQTWSQQQGISLAQTRRQWRPKTRMWSILGLRFTLPNPTVAGFGALEVGAEPLNG